MTSRRGFLLVAATVSATAAGGAYIGKPQLRKWFLPKLDTTYPLGVLENPEMRNIVALGEAIAAPESLPPAGFFSDYVNSVTRSQPGFLKEYKRAVVVLTLASARMGDREVSAPGHFADLSIAQRDEVLRTLLWQYSGDDHVTPKIEKIVCSRSAVALRIFVMRPLIEHYYRSVFGWQVLGYESFPGRPPVDPHVYTKPIPD